MVIFIVLEKGFIEKKVAGIPLGGKYPFQNALRKRNKTEDSVLRYKSGRGGSFEEGKGIRGRKKESLSWAGTIHYSRCKVGAREELRWQEQKGGAKGN